MPSVAPRIVVEGDKKLQRDFLKLRREVVAGMRAELLKTAEKVRDDAHRGVLDGPDAISHMAEDSRWAEFRLGISTARGFRVLGALGLGATRTPMMYVAPKAHRRDGPPRANLAPALAKVMQSSADKYEAEVWAEVEALVDAQVARTNL